MTDHKQLYISLSSSIVSIGHFIIAAETRSIIAWVVGIIAGMVAIYASITTIRTNKLRMREIEENIKRMRHEIENKYSHNKN
jgi:uncharacterized membrane-anchored protein YhcB (DUF1043 family)